MNIYKNINNKIYIFSFIILFNEMICIVTIFTYFNQSPNKMDRTERIYTFYVIQMSLKKTHPIKYNYTIIKVFLLVWYHQTSI